MNLNTIISLLKSNTRSLLGRFEHHPNRPNNVKANSIFSLISEPNPNGRATYGVLDDEKKKLVTDFVINNNNNLVNSLTGNSGLKSKSMLSSRRVHEHAEDLAGSKAISRPSVASNSGSNLGPSMKSFHQNQTEALNADANPQINQDMKLEYANNKLPTNSVPKVDSTPSASPTPITPPTLPNQYYIKN